MFDELMRIWSEEQFEISLVAARTFTAARNRVMNLRPSALPPYAFWNVEELWLDGPLKAAETKTQETVP